MDIMTRTNWKKGPSSLTSTTSSLGKNIFGKKISRVNWLKEGDQNTRFFYLSTLKHHANNRISSIKKGQSPLSKDDKIVDEAVQFFSSLLTKDPSLLLTDQEDILSAIPSLLQAHHNSMLKAIPSLEEIFQALNSLLGEKAPGLDNFMTFFF